MTYDGSSSKQFNSVNLNNSIYKTNNQSVDGYVYCSGPLLDDDSDSETEDYFNYRPMQKIVVD
jgi:hypothetical protein